MHVTVQAVVVHEEKRLTLIDRFFETVRTSWEYVPRQTVQATVNGIPWTVAQTEQALRDAALCRCGTCACCAIRKAARS